jgi:hypothetical protein
VFDTIGHARAGPVEGFNLKQELEFELTDREFRRSWLAEYYRRPGFRSFRIFAGPVVFTAGAMMLRDAHEPSGRAAGAVALVYGVYHALRPFLLVMLVMRRRRKLGQRKYRLTIDEGGIAISDGKGSSQIPWKDVSASGLGDGYLWYEVRKSARATIPFRAMADRRELESMFREWGHFQP